MSGQTIIDRFTSFISNVFKTNLEVFFEALKLSPNAQGYVSGSITELLLKRRLQGSLLSLTEDWLEDFGEVYSTLKREEGVDERPMQVDNRNIVVIEIDQDA